ncbi:MAG TPA: hypothetical protein VFY18_14205 [Candidatus Limnocylindrales bacterium]|nr:hypothetical protein [Candidatus Limnocylindrales bacterium]
MTVNAARRTRRRTSVPKPEPIVAPTESLAIGEINQTVFDCPKCARPLAIGVSRCPGCGTRLVLGIPLAKVSIFVSGGVAIGIAVGAVFSFGLGIGRAVAATPPATTSLPSQPTVPAGGGPTATPTPTTVPGTGGTTDMPPITRSALTQALGVNGRLGAGADALRASLAARDFDASAVAQTLRSMSADSVFGQQLASRLTSWPSSTSLGGNLDALYDSVHQSATEWLVASVRDEKSYRSAATAMLDVLSGLAAIDAEARALADGIGIAPSPAAAP